jgi:hypothetical protein
VQTPEQLQAELEGALKNRVFVERRKRPRSVASLFPL